MNLKVNKQNSICINNNIYIDPLHLGITEKAKYIFLTHPHWDHFSVEDINKILIKETVIICPKSMENEILQFSNKVVLVEPEKSYKLKDLEFSTFRSYNIQKQFHPKENNWVGYDLKIENNHVVIIGDSDNTPELKRLKADVLLIPIGGTFTMNVEEAAELTNIICPKKVIPTHYGDIVGDSKMGERFASMLKRNIECEILL